jgi:hypothetical protein
LILLFVAGAWVGRFLNRGGRRPSRTTAGIVLGVFVLIGLGLEFFEPRSTGLAGACTCRKSSADIFRYCLKISHM